MPSKSPQLGILHVAPHQHQPELRRDLGIDHADEATQGLTTHASASDVFISAADLGSYFMHKITGSPAAAGHLWIPPIERRFAVWNTTGQDLYLRTVGQPWSTVITLATGSAKVYYSDGSAISVSSGNPPQVINTTAARITLDAKTATIEQTAPPGGGGNLLLDSDLTDGLLLDSDLTDVLSLVAVSSGQILIDSDLTDGVLIDSDLTDVVLIDN